MSKVWLSDYVDSLCEVRTADNDLLCIGKIARTLSDGDIIIQRKNDDFPILALNEPVKINVANYKLGSMFLSGLVYISNFDFMQVKKISIVSDSEKRKAFRLNHSGCAYIYKESEQPPMPPFETISFVNISLTGFLCQCAKELMPNEQYILEFDISGQKIFLNFVVARKVPSENELNTYGCTFYNVDRKTEDKLLLFLQKLQREDIRKLKNPLL